MKEIAAFEGQMKVLQEALEEARRSSQEEIGRYSRILEARDAEIKTLRETLEWHAQQLNSRLAELTICENDRDRYKKEGDAKVTERDIIIGRQKDEIERIYNSETYRLIARPIIWPMFSVAKKVKALLSLNIVPRSTNNFKGDIGISIAYLSAESITARYLQDNRYTVKLVNRSHSPREVKLLLDFWPSQNRYHPQRHYAFYSAVVRLPEKESIEITFTYDWDKKAAFYAGLLELEKVDSWRGSMRSPELYQIYAYIYGWKDGGELDNKAIIQKLQL